MPASRSRKTVDNGHVEIDGLTLAWFRSVRDKNIPISVPLIQGKTLFFARSLGIADFKASNGWLARFKLRHQITGAKVCGESAIVSERTVDDWKTRLPEIPKGYEPHDIFNFDKSGFFYRALPDNPPPRFKGTDCKGGKVARKRLTVGFCCNMAGDFEKLFVIGKSANSRCFKSIDQKSLPVSYVSSNRAWMTTTLFTSWLTKFNEKMRRQNRNVILFLDNATCHSRQDLSNVELFFFPPNTTSHLQPLEQGIIRCVKARYQERLLQSALSEFEQMDNVDSIRKGITVLDACHWIARSTCDIKARTVLVCFAKSGFGGTVPQCEQER